MTVLHNLASHNVHPQVVVDEHGKFDDFLFLLVFEVIVSVRNI
jgi:hypothetical protein